MQNIKNIIFDYGNVLFAIDFSRAQRAFSDLGIKNVDQIYAHAGQNPLFDDFDKGLLSAAEFREGVRELVELPELSDEQIDGAWNALLIGVEPFTHELLLQFKEQYRTFLLSNNNAIHYQWILEHLQGKYGLADNSGFFEQDYYSHLMGMRKPDPEIFELVLQEQKLVPEETLFLDDSPQHLETARQLGLKTALVKHPQELPSIAQALELL